MTRSIGNVVADSLQLGLGYSERLAKDIEANKFARLAAPGGQIVESNHPAFIFGHLSLYAPQIAGQLRQIDSLPDASEDFKRVFSKDAQCVDDAEGSIYPPMDEVMEKFFAGYRAVHSTLREVPDYVMLKDNPTGGRMSELFPTLGSLHGFYVGGHMMLHLGQLSAWRRMQGLGPA